MGGAGHKGHPDSVRQRGRNGRRRRLKGAHGRGTLAKEKPPIFGLFQRNGDVAIRRRANVQQATVHPIITTTVKPGSRLYTDEYDIYSRLTDWGYEHKTVNHSQGEYARDEDGEGFHEVHINTLEGFWSLLRCPELVEGLRPHRGISQEKWPTLPEFLRHGSKKADLG